MDQKVVSELVLEADGGHAYRHESIRSCLTCHHVWLA